MPQRILKVIVLKEKGDIEVLIVIEAPDNDKEKRLT